MTPTYQFDPNKLGYYEKAGWEAYYERDWPRAFRLLVLLNREQFHMSWPAALAGAIDTVRASIAFAPVDNDLQKTKDALERFYKRARQALGIRTNAATLAELELDYWVIHRQLAIRRAQNPQDNDITPMIDSLARLHAALFNSTPEQMRVSAALRGLAAARVDLITGKRSADIAADWRMVEQYLQQAYCAVQHVQGVRQ